MVFEIFHRLSNIDLRSHHWPNRQTVVNSISVIAVIGCLTLHASKRTTFLVNLPGKILNISRNQRNYSQVACDVAALAVLFLPYGQFASIAIDVTAEVINFFQSRHLENQTTEPLENSSDQSNCCMRAVANAGSRVRDSFHQVLERVQQFYNSMIFSPPMSIEERSYLASRESMRLARIRLEQPGLPPTEEEARQILDLPAEGRVSMFLVRKNKEILLRRVTRHADRDPPVIRWMTPLCIRRINEACEVMDQAIGYDSWNRDRALVAYTGGFLRVQAPEQKSKEE